MIIYWCNIVFLVKHACIIFIVWQTRQIAKNLPTANTNNSALQYLFFSKNPSSHLLT